MTKINSSNKTAANLLRTHIIDLLKEGEFISGEYMSNKFGITRSSVSNHIKALSLLGLDIFSVKGRGYKLAQPLLLLEESRIRELMSSNHDAFIQVNNIVSSTNDVIRAEVATLPQGSVCLAEAQMSGRGRRGRKWVSPFGASIYMSMVWRFKDGYQSMSGLSLLVGIALNRALHGIGATNCRLKWPNDVYHDGKKLAGILVELEGPADGIKSAIIGIGVNIQLPSNLDDIGQPFTDVSSVVYKQIDRNEFVCRLLEELWIALPEFEAHGLTPFLQQWQEADLFYGKPISLISGKHVCSGISKGIDKSGALLLESNGQVKPYHGGEISVRQTQTID